MAVIAVAEMFGIQGRRDELIEVLTRAEAESAAQEGCRRYVFAATLADPDTFLLLSEWETQDALDAHYKSAAFMQFQLDLDGLLATASQLTEYRVSDAVRPLNTRPMDPRDAD